MGGCVSRPLIDIQVGNVQFYTRSVIQEGGFGIVYHVEEKKTSENLAVKVISTKNDENLISKVRYEIGMLKNFRHTKEIIHLIAVDYSADGNYFLVFPHFPRGSLAELLSAFRRFNLRLTKERIIFFLSHIINGLIWLHTLGYIHRDLKPANFLLNEKDHVVIIDLGSMMRRNIIVGNNKERTRLIDECNEKCSMLYRPPELFTCELGSYITEKVDIWMLGCCIYEFIYTRNPMEAVHASGNSVALASLSPERFPYPDDHRVDAELLEIVKKMLKAEPGKRISLRQLREMVNNIMTTESPQTVVEYNKQEENNWADFKEPAPFINEDGSFLPSVPEQEEGSESSSSDQGFGEFVSAVDPFAEDEITKEHSDPPPISPRGPVPFNPMRFYIKQAADRCRKKCKQKFSKAEKMTVVNEEPEDSSKTTSTTQSPYLPKAVPSKKDDQQSTSNFAPNRERDFDYFYLPPRGKPVTSQQIPEEGHLPSKRTTDKANERARQTQSDPQVQFSMRFIENYTYFNQNGFCIPLDNLPSSSHISPSYDTVGGSSSSDCKNKHCSSPKGANSSNSWSNTPLSPGFSESSPPQRWQSGSPNNSNPNSPRRKYMEPRPSPYHYLPFDPWSTGTSSYTEQGGWNSINSESASEGQIPEKLGRSDQRRSIREILNQQTSNKNDHKGYHDPFLMLEPPMQKPEPEIPLIENICEVKDRPGSPFVIWRQSRIERTRLTKRRIDQVIRNSPYAERAAVVATTNTSDASPRSFISTLTKKKSKNNNHQTDANPPLPSIPDPYDDSDDAVSSDSDSSIFNPREGTSNVPYV